MRLAKKARQRKRKEETKAKAEQKATLRADKAFAATVMRNEKKGYPHMEWDGVMFIPRRPAPSPKLKVNASIMHSAHRKLGVRWKGSRRGIYKPRSVNSIADTGCQTCTAGVNFLEEIGCPQSYLVPTSHEIVGITAASLGIIGSVMLRIECGGEVTRQMVHISTHAQGLYMSRTACEELKLVSPDFPRPSRSISTSMCAPAESLCRGDCNGDENGTQCPTRATTPDRPSKIPFPPTKENKGKLKDWLLKTFAGSAFNMCTYQKLQGMTGMPMEIVLRNHNHIGAAAYRPIPVPFHFKSAVKEDLDKDERMGIIEKVPQGDTSEWCSRMVITPKGNGKPRRTVDFQELNKATVREIHHTPSPINLVSSVPAGKLKTVADVWNAFHSLDLDEESKPYTTFITEWGRYRYSRGPQGFHGTGDAYTRRFDDITSKEERYVRCIDDGLLYDDDVEAAFWHTFDHLKHCADNGVVFNREKFKFAEETVDFAGFEITKDGFKPSESTIEAIKNFPTPTNITDVRAWFGLVGYVSYAFSQNSIMHPFRCLLEKKRPFYWDDTLDRLFKASKAEIVKKISQGVYAYDIKKSTCLATDWSKDGLGFSLTQKHCDCSGVADPNCGVDHWRVVFAGSKTTNGAQKRYAPIEGECLAAAYGLERCRMYTLGCSDLTLAVDHKPLTNILNDRHLDTITNPRLRRLKEKTFPFRFQIKYVPGGSNAMKVADALSRHAVDSEEETDHAFESVERAARAYATMQGDNVESVTWRRVNEAAAVDEECVALCRLIIDGFPEEKSMLPSNLQSYWGMRDDIYIIENVPFKGHKMLIPKVLRPQVLEGLHAANQGVTGMLANARDHFFWPGLDAAIRQMRSQCRQCNENAPSQHAEPTLITPPPEVPFQQTVADLFSLEGHSFLAYADRFSGWLEVERLPNTSFRYVRPVLLRLFSTFEVPEELATDGGSPFKGIEHQQFLRNWDVEWRLSSAYYPQSNGRAEAAVKSAKRILEGNINPVTGALDTDSAARALMAHRNTPAQDTGISPAVILFGRNLRDHLPRINNKLRPEWDAIASSRETALAKRALKGVEVERKELEPLHIGDNIQLQNQHGNHPGKWYSTGVISAVLPFRKYQVIVDGSRRTTIRNRRFLRKIFPISQKEIIPPELPPTSVIVTPSEPRTFTPQTTTPLTTTPLTTMPLTATPQRTMEVKSTSYVPKTLDFPQTHLVFDNVITSTPRVNGNIVPDFSPNIEPTPADSGGGLRRSGRTSVSVKPFSAKLKGKYHETQPIS